MSVWAVLAFGLVGLLTFSVLVGLSLGAILGQISREISDLLESEPWQRVTTVETGSPAEAARIGSRSSRSRLSAPAA